MANSGTTLLSQTGKFWYHSASQTGREKLESEKEESIVSDKQVDLEEKSKEDVGLMAGRLEEWSYQRPKLGSQDK